MIEINSTEFFVLALFVAMALVALLFGQGSNEEPTTQIIALALNPCITSDEGLIVLQAQDDGGILILRNALPLDEGDTVNLVVTVAGYNITIVEKKGVQSRNAIDFVADGTAHTSPLPAARFRVRYESEITGQWALFTFSNRNQCTVTRHLSF